MYHVGGSWEIIERTMKFINGCGIAGKWHAKYVATISLTCKPDPSLTGVGTLSGIWSNAPDNHYPLKGRYTKVNNDYYLGFTVAFNNAHLGNSGSVSGLTGMYDAAWKSMTTFWVMTNKTNPQDNWQNSKIGKAVFTRVSN